MYMLDLYPQNYRWNDIHAVLAGISMGPEDEEALKGTVITMFKLVGNKIKYYMFRVRGDKFDVEDGTLVKGTMKANSKTSRPVSQLRALYMGKKAQGYQLTSKGELEAQSSEDKILDELFGLLKRLRDFSRGRAKSTEDLYSVKLSVEVIQRCQELLTQLVGEATEVTEESLDNYIKEFNTRLTRILMCLLKKDTIQKRLIKFTVKSKKNVASFNKKVSKVIEEEQAFLD